MSQKTLILIGSALILWAAPALALATGSCESSNSWITCTVDPADNQDGTLTLMADRSGYADFYAQLLIDNTNTSSSQTATITYKIKDQNPHGLTGTNKTGFLTADWTVQDATYDNVTCDVSIAADTEGKENVTYQLSVVGDEVRDDEEELEAKGYEYHFYEYEVNNTASDLAITVKLEFDESELDDAIEEMDESIEVYLDGNSVKWEEGSVILEDLQSLTPGMHRAKLKYHSPIPAPPKLAMTPGMLAIIAVLLVGLLAYSAWWLLK